MARVLKDLGVLPAHSAYIDPPTESAFTFPAEAGNHFTDQGGMEG